MNDLVLDAIRKVREIESKRKSIQSKYDFSDWEGTKVLLGDDNELYRLWCRESNELSRLLGVTVYSSPC